MPKITKLCLHLLKLYRNKLWPLFSGHDVHTTERATIRLLQIYACICHALTILEVRRSYKAVVRIAVGLYRLQRRFLRASIVVMSGRRAFSVAGPTVWNSLPEDMRDPECSVDSYRQSLKTFLFSQY